MKFLLFSLAGTASAEATTPVGEAAHVPLYVPAASKFETVTIMGRWAKDQTVFDVVVTPNIGRGSSSSRIPKPVLAKLGDPERIRFTIKGNKITLSRAD